jgi:hypothetical protein
MKRQMRTVFLRVLFSPSGFESASLFKLFSIFLGGASRSRTARREKKSLKEDFEMIEEPIFGSTRLGYPST